MVNYCQECGEKVEGKFQFCPFCGKKLIKPKICSNCGVKLKENYQFCPECGKKWDSLGKKSIISALNKDKKTEGYESIDVEKPVKKTKQSKKESHKPTHLKFSLSFLNKFKKSKKMLLILSLIIIVIVAAAAIIILNPFGSNGTSSGDSSFSITIQNEYGENLQYYLLVDGYYNIGGLNNPYEIIDGDSTTINVNENDLTIQKSSHSTTLFISIDGISWDSEIASDVTDSVNFLVSEVDGEINIISTI